MTKRRIPLMVGNLIEVAGIMFAIFLIISAPRVAVIPLKFLLYLVAWFCLLFFPHGLTHYLVGRIVGIRFRYYSVGKSSASKLRIRFLNVIAGRLVVLTLKVDQSSLRSVSPGRRSLMFSSGAVASMILPFFTAASSFGDLPIVLSVILLLISLANFVSDIYFSPKIGDISRAKSA